MNDNVTFPFVIVFIFAQFRLSNKKKQSFSNRQREYSSKKRTPPPCKGAIVFVECKYIKRKYKKTKTKRNKKNNLKENL